MKRTALTIILVLMLLASCSTQTPVCSLTGKWVRESQGITHQLVLDSDGTGIYIRSQGNKTSEISFCWDSDDYCFYVFDGGFFPEIYEYHIEGDELHIIENVFFKEA